jgi:serine/threonine-protein kinase
VDWAAAEASLQRALELEPEAEKVLTMMSFHLSTQQRHDEALALARRAEKNCPLSVLASSTVGMHLYHARRYDEAVTHLVEKTIEMDRAFPPGYIIVAWTYVRMGRFDEAVSAAKKAAELTNHAPPRRAALASALAAAGRTDEAETIVSQLLKERDSQYVSALDIAIVAAHLGKIDEAFEWLDRAFEERSPWLNQLHGDPVWDPIRDDPRFGTLAERVGLA